MMIAVGNEQPSARLVREHFAGEAQRRVGRLGRFEERKRRGVEQSLLAVIGQSAVDHRLDVLKLPLAVADPKRLACRVDQHKRRPALDAIAIPDCHVRVVDDRMADSVAENRLADVARVLLPREFRRMDADHDQFVGVSLFELFEFRQDVHAIDAAEGPKVDEHELAPQVAERDRAGGVDPLEIAVQRRCLDAAGKGMCGDRRPAGGRLGRTLTECRTRHEPSGRHHQREKDGPSCRSAQFGHSLPKIPGMTIMPADGSGCADGKLTGLAHFPSSDLSGMILCSLAA